jgi:putative DNA-invertase from lambdoid prophage Rac
MAVYGYSRVSGAKQVKEGISLEVQQRQIEGWCMIDGQTLDRTFVEEGVSGSVPVTKRPEGHVMMSLVKAGDTIVTPRLDRLFRSALDALQTVEWAQKRKVRIVIIDGLGDITGNGISKAFLTISAAFAELERDTIRERISTVKADQKDRGRYLGGKPPFGFRVDHDGSLIPIEAEQQVIRKIIATRRTKKSIRFIREMLMVEDDRSLSLGAIHRIIHDYAGQVVPPPSEE